MIQRVCLITPGHIASNPRLVKEASTLSQAGFNVHIIFTQYVDYLLEHDKKILQNNPQITYDYISWTKTSFTSRVNRILSGVKSRLSKRTELKINRNYSWQLKKALANHADLYIAHNLGALPVAVRAAKISGMKCMFDAEDLHRFQAADDMDDPRVKQTISIENRFIPQLNYLTSSSPDIAEQYHSLFDKDVICVLNVFKKTSVKVRENIRGPLNVFWFSQTIGPNRGIEMAIEAIRRSSAPVHLHLMGNITEEYRQQLDRLADADNHKSLKLIFYPTVFPDDIFDEAARFDIGLASEPGFCLNNKLALSNKLFTYIQCGLAVVATATIAQEKVLHRFPEVGKLYKGLEELAAIIADFHNDRSKLYQMKKASFELGQLSLNWENESKKILKVLNMIDID